MSKEFLTELKRIKTLISYEIGNVISEGRVLVRKQSPDFFTGSDFECVVNKLKVLRKLDYDNATWEKEGDTEKLWVPTTNNSGSWVFHRDQHRWENYTSKGLNAKGIWGCKSKSDFWVRYNNASWDTSTEDWKSDETTDKSSETTDKFTNSPYSCIVNWADSLKVEGEPTGGNIVVNMPNARWNFSSQGYWNQVGTKYEGNWKCLDSENFTISSTDGETYNSKEQKWSKSSTTDFGQAVQVVTKQNVNKRLSSGSDGGSTTSKSKFTDCPETLPIKQFCRNNKIKEIQIKLGMPKKYQTGNFGPITLGKIIEKVPEFNKDEGITQPVLDKIMGTTSSPDAQATVNLGSTSVSPTGQTTQTPGGQTQDTPITGIK